MLHAFTRPPPQRTRAPAWSLPTSRPSGTRCPPALPLAVRPRNGTGALALALALTGLRGPRTSKAGGQMARTAASGPLCLLVWGPAVEHPRTAAAAAPALLHAQAHPHSHSLSLSHSVGRLRFVFLPLLSPPLFTLFFLLPTFLTRPRQSTPFPRETALSAPRVRMNLPHSWSVSSSLPYPPLLNLLVPRGASSPRPRVDFSNLSS